MVLLPGIMSFDSGSEVGVLEESPASALVLRRSPMAERLEEVRDVSRIGSLPSPGTLSGGCASVTHGSFAGDDLSVPAVPSVDLPDASEGCDDTVPTGSGTVFLDFDRNDLNRSRFRRGFPWESAMAEEL
jgi:hypothetical protein